MPTDLSVNLNKIALLRNSRDGQQPSVLTFARYAIESGAQGITVHPRPDQRHIRTDDVYELSTELKSNKAIEFNIEGNPFAPANADGYPGFMALVEKTRPEQATLVPDGDDQLTSDHGFNLLLDGERLKPIIQQLKSWGIRISLFMDPDIEQISLAKSLGVDRIELYTGPYAEQFEDDRDAILSVYQKAASHAHSIGLGINAGHDLNLDNLEDFLTIPHIKEVSIGHALTVDALLIGYKAAVSAYSKICGLDYNGKEK